MKPLPCTVGSGAAVAANRVLRPNACFRPEAIDRHAMLAGMSPFPAPPKLGRASKKCGECGKDPDPDGPGRAQGHEHARPLLSRSQASIKTRIAHPQKALKIFLLMDVTLAKSGTSAPGPPEATVLPSRSTAFQLTR